MVHISEAHRYHTYIYMYMWYRYIYIIHISMSHIHLYVYIYMYLGQNYIYMYDIHVLQIYVYIDACISSYVCISIWFRYNIIWYIHLWYIYIPNVYSMWRHTFQIFSYIWNLKLKVMFIVYIFVKWCYVSALKMMHYLRACSHWISQHFFSLWVWTFCCF